MTNLDNILKSRDIILPTNVCLVKAICCPPCLFNFYAEYIMRNAGLEEARDGIKIDRRNINYLSYADDTTFMAESEEELKSLLPVIRLLRGTCLKQPLEDS